MKKIDRSSIAQQSIVCPGLYYAVPAKDGILFRLRIPSGIITWQQCSTIAEIAEEVADGTLQVTNRSNLQLRATVETIAPELLQKLQQCGLAARNETVDRLRNIMTSPTAGIDRAQLIDTRPLATELAVYIENNPRLASLPPKFSVGFAGGETVTIAGRSNEFLLSAETMPKARFAPAGKVYFRLILNAGKEKHSIDTRLLFAPSQYLPAMQAAISAYLDAIDNKDLQTASQKQKPRLSDILDHLGRDWYLDRLLSYLPFPPKYASLGKTIVTEAKPIAENLIIGVYPQLQEGLSYLGINLPLGNLEAWQLRKLGRSSEVFGTGELRLTPWQSLSIVNVPEAKIDDLKAEILNLGLNCDPNHPYNGLVACAGNTGCAKSATDTQKHALALAEYLATKISPDKPASNIHFTGCPKSCAQGDRADITFLGKTIQKDDRTIEVYQIYVKGEGESKFGRLVADNIDPNSDIKSLLSRLN
jgi:ferredoxin-nitrite reductase